ncbi:MAG TPA: LysR family transcriptional regulator [Pseudolabrys sp.]|nr:LysR family transcriptional regulator [Pseudolabrys sp.]
MDRRLQQRLKMRMLRAVECIEREKSLLKASKELGVTQPALTRTLHETETILGGRIFERHSRGITITEFGEVACNAVRRVLTQVNRIDRDLDRFLAGDTTLVAVGAMPPAAVGLLPELFGKMRTEVPHIHAQLTLGSMEELIPLLNDGVLDMIVGRLFPAAIPDEFVREILYYEPLCIIGRTEHPVFAIPDATTDDLAEYRFILPNMSRLVEQEIEVVLATMNLTRTIEMRSASLPFLREILHTSNHLLISPPMTMAGDLKRGTLRRLDFTIPGPPRPAGLLMRRDYSLSAASQTFVETMRAYLRERPHPF